MIHATTGFSANDYNFVKLSSKLASYDVIKFILA